MRSAPAGPAAVVPSWYVYSTDRTVAHDPEPALVRWVTDASSPALVPEATYAYTNDSVRADPPVPAVRCTSAGYPAVVQLVTAVTCPSASAAWISLPARPLGVDPEKS